MGGPYLDKDWNEAIEKYAKKQAEKFFIDKEKSIKEQLDEMDWQRKDKERYNSRFWPKKMD